ncbi:MAG: Ornithine carbamoyltransferase [Verrucomicrobia subdivision 3 bacterium]|nr:Ornithine carbamoyltransferase [Limisphaerales bacterium]MCS1414608.1 Ornithine carbamoyltransferase [Limisphaerales bacterium]
MKHFLSLEEHSTNALKAILKRSEQLKSLRGDETHQPLKGQTWALIFSKSSTRTRVSFEVGIRELGGRALFLSARELQLGRGEPIRDTARVLGRMVHGAVIRTFDHQELVDFAAYGKIPTINALTDHAHPCQIMADILTVQEKMGTIEDRVVAFIGDGACNVATSWVFAASKFGFELRIAAPEGFRPNEALLQRIGGNVRVTDDVRDAARGADVLYTDVWVSMGMESEAEAREQTFQGFQINDGVVREAKESVLVMHCLPAYRGKEITDAVLEAHQQTVFDQAENRLHAQKGVICWLLDI